MCTRDSVFWQPLCVQLHGDTDFFIERQHLLVFCLFVSNFNSRAYSMDRRLILCLLNYFVIFFFPHARHRAHKSQHETTLCASANVKIWQL